MTDIIPEGDYDLPSDFTNVADGRVSFADDTWTLSGATVESIDFTTAGTHVKYYVDYATGSDSDTGLTPELAFKSFDKAADTAIAGAVPAEIIIIDEWIGYLSVIQTVWTFTADIKIRSGSPSGKTLVTQKRESYSGTFAWTDNGDGTFSSDTNQADHSACFDDLYQDVYGGASPQTPVETAAECVALAGSFFYDDVDTMMVHMQDDREPDEDWIYCSALTSAKMRFLMDTTDGAIILENLSAYSNNKGVRQGGLSGRCTTFTGNTAKVGVKDCLSYGAQDGYAFYSFQTSIYENCVSRYTTVDGFSHHTQDQNDDGGFMTVYENYCKAYDAGWTKWIGQLAAGTSNNCSSAHDNINILRVGCEYLRAVGPVLADVSGCDSWNFGVNAEFPNLTAESDTNAAFHGDAATDLGTPHRMFLIGCGGSDRTTGAATAYTMTTANSITSICYQFWQGNLPVTIVGSVAKCVQYPETAARSDLTSVNMCERSGFRALPGELVKEPYTGRMVLKEFRDTDHDDRQNRHSFRRSRPRKVETRNEDINFISTAVTQDDL